MCRVTNVAGAARRTSERVVHVDAIGTAQQTYHILHVKVVTGAAHEALRHFASLASVGAFC